jgi:hypothetical protein
MATWRSVTPIIALAIMASVCWSLTANAQSADVQQQLSNPISSLTLLPVQLNYDRGIGPAGDGYKVTTNIQPVVPFKLNNDMSLVVRTIVPIVGQHQIFPGAGDQFGLGDSLQSFFLVPKTVNGFTWGVGPALLWRTGTDRLLSTGKWAAGPTAVALQQSGPWTVGVLANHIWSFAGDERRADVSSTYVQPFVAYAAAGGWTYTLNTETTYNWQDKEWSVPVNFMISKLMKIGPQPVSFQAGVRYWAHAPESQGPEGWAGRIGVTFIYP